MSVILYRPAKIEDAGKILQFIKDLAVYEKLAHEVSATESDIELSLFGDNPKAFAVMAEMKGEPVGFALGFYNFSTFLGKPGIYVEDIYVPEQYRGQGIGKGFFEFFTQKAITEDCGRVEWWCLDWNEPSIKFYENLGAKAMSDWTVYRLEGEALADIAEQRKKAA